MSGFMSTCISILSTWTGRAKKLDEVQFSIPSRMKTENGTQLWAMTRQAKHAEGGIDGTATNYEKLGRMYQKGRWKSSEKRLVYTITLWSDAGLLKKKKKTRAVRPEEWKFLSQQLQTFLICPESTSRSENSSVGTSGNLNNLDSLLVLWFQTIPNQQNFTKQDERFSFSTIFSGCQIGQVHVIFKSDQAQWHSTWSSFLTESRIFWTFRLFSTNFRHFSPRFRRIQSWYCFHLLGFRLLADDVHKFWLL